MAPQRRPLTGLNLLPSALTKAITNGLQPRQVSPAPMVLAGQMTQQLISAGASRLQMGMIIIITPMSWTRRGMRVIYYQMATARRAMLTGTPAFLLRAQKVEYMV